jgi:hypothetical protein
MACASLGTGLAATPKGVRETVNSSESNSGRSSQAMPNKTPIIDAHVHCWSRWPETMPKVFAAEDYGSVKWLLHEMQKASVDRAVIVCAEIAPGIESNQYAAKCHKEYPGKFYIFADLDSFFWPTYGKEGAADRLRKLLDSQKVHGLSQYWFGASEAERFLSKNNL